MKITIEHTNRIVEVNGVPARVWQGVSDTGIPCFVLVTRIAVALGQDQSAFEQDLLEQRQPTPEAESVFALRIVL